MTKINKHLTAVLPDIHIPEHDPQAVERCLDRIKEENPGTIVLLGDILDFHAISRFSRKLDKRAVFWDEIKEGKRFLRMLGKRFKDKKIHYLCGNHESRLGKYIVRMCPELAGIPQLAFKELLDVPDSWGLYPYNLNAVQINGVSYVHGRKFTNGVCMSNLKRFMGSVVQGHSHRASSAYLRLPSGELIGAVESGCLCNLNPGYASDVTWAHGMAWAENGLPYLELL